MVGSVRPALLALLASVGVLVVILGVNVAHLTLLRGLAESRATAIRVSLGASPARAVSRLVAESIILAVLGGAIGLPLAVPLRAALLTMAPASLPRSPGAAMDWRVVTVGAAASLVFALACSLVLMTKLRRQDLRRLLDSSARSSTGSSGATTSDSCWIPCGHTASGRGRR
jgi:predicted lysophospholipase L1 biosynthesis ABC-type transport system permease subunit